MVRVLHALCVSFVLMAFVVSQRLAALPPTAPYTQCTVGCEPCVGPDDPFCVSSGPADPPPLYCNACDNRPGSATYRQCYTVKQGDTGYNTCTVVTVGNTRISCSTSGGTCKTTGVTP